jgi:hypothetical protein
MISSSSTCAKMTLTIFSMPYEPSTVLLKIGIVIYILVCPSIGTTIMVLLTFHARVHRKSTPTVPTCSTYQARKFSISMRTTQIRKDYSILRRSRHVPTFEQSRNQAHSRNLWHTWQVLSSLRVLRCWFAPPLQNVTGHHGAPPVSIQVCRYCLSFYSRMPRLCVWSRNFTAEFSFAFNSAECCCGGDTLKRC